MTNHFEATYETLLIHLKARGSNVPMSFWQSQSVADRPGMSYSRELRHEQLQIYIPDHREQLATLIKPNLPWAEDHFQERVSGEPLNPPPSEAWWPFRVKQNAEHKEVEGKQFSHTYPERIWPKYANVGATRPNGRQVFVPHNGIRYEVGDLGDVIELLIRDPFTRQAYLPIWFPEDTGAVQGQRVPCTLGYHFLLRPSPSKSSNELQAHLTYHIRSCDLFRHFRDDVYMAGRLLQWVVGMLRDAEINVRTHLLIMNITSLHLFEGDMVMLDKLVQEIFDRDEGAYGAAI